jgi:hypothetical protein
MTETTVSDAVVFPQDQGTGVTSGNEDFNSAGYFGTLTRNIDGEHVGNGLAFSNVDTTNDTFDLTSGYVFVKQSAVDVQSGANATHDTTLPNDIVTVVTLPSDVTGLSLDSDSVNDVYLYFASSAQDNVKVRYGSSVSQPPGPSVHLGTIDTSDGSTARASDYASPELTDITFPELGGATFSGHDHSESDLTAVSNGGLANDSVTVAGNSVSLGGSTSVTHSDISNISSDDHHSQIQFSDSGTAVLTQPTDVNFDSSLDVTDDGDGTITVDANTSSSYTDEDAQDAVGTILSSQFTYDDSSPAITLNPHESTADAHHSRIQVSDSGAAVLTQPTDVNFASDLNVTDDGDGTVTIDASTSGSYSDEDAQDAVGGILSSQFTYDDANDTIDISSDGIKTNELDLSISPTWTGTHDFSASPAINLSSSGAIQDDGTNALTFDGSQNVTVPNGGLSLTGTSGHVTVGDTYDSAFIDGLGFRTVSEGVDAASNYVEQYVDASSVPAVMSLRKARGTVSSPTAVQDGDRAGRYAFAAYDGSNFDAIGRIEAYIDGSVSTDQTPSMVEIQTDSGGSGLKKGLEIDSSQDITLPNGSLTVSDASLGIGVGVDGGSLSPGTVFRTERNGASHISIATFQTNYQEIAFRVDRAEGTKTSPSLVTEDTLLGSYEFRGYDGADYATGAEVRALADGTTGENDMPSRLELRTAPGGGIGTDLGLEINSNQNVIIPSGGLKIVGDEENSVIVMDEYTDSVGSTARLMKTARGSKSKPSNVQSGDSIDLLNSKGWINGDFRDGYAMRCVVNDVDSTNNNLATTLNIKVPRGDGGLWSVMEFRGGERPDAVFTGGGSLRDDNDNRYMREARAQELAKR